MNAAWEAIFANWLKEISTDFDAAHDLEHIRRVVQNAKRLAEPEHANLAIVLPAAWLHDCVSVPKNSPQRSRASLLAAERAGQFLKDMDYPGDLIPDIEHAIAAHSFTAQIPPETIEAKVVQDADRLDAIGAVGIARCLMLGGVFGSTLYHASEPIPKNREIDDKKYAIDHFYAKLFSLCDTMQTNAGKQEAQRRTAYMQGFIDKLIAEIS